MGFYQGDGNDSDTTAFNDKYIKDQKFATAPFWGLFPKLKDMDDRDDTLFPLPFKFNFRDFGDNAFAMASGIPTVKQFDKCQELNGLSAWTPREFGNVLSQGKQSPPCPNWTFSCPWRTSSLTNRIPVGCSSTISTFF